MNSSSVQDAYVHQYKSARVFLEKCSLLQYLPIFITEGFDSIEAINEITEEDLSEMGIKRGHRRVMQRAIATEKGIPTYQPLTYLVANPTSSINSNFGWETSANENASSGSSSGGNYSTSGYGSMSSSQPSSTTPLRYSHSKPEDSMIDMSDSVHNGEAMIKGIANSSYSSNEELEEVEMLDEQDEEDEDEDDDCTIQRKYRRHPKRDKNTPIKPPSAYIMFSNDARTQLKDQNMTFVEIAKYVGDLWKNLDSSRKREYERTAMREKDHYVDRLNRYRKTPEYKKYQVYLKDFKSKQDAMNRKIARFRKLAKLESANSANSGSNTNGNSTS
ncbi:HMG-box, partial [Backusella circina FSU 941]